MFVEEGFVHGGVEHHPGIGVDGKLLYDLREVEVLQVDLPAVADNHQRGHELYNDLADVLHHDSVHEIRLV